MPFTIDDISVGMLVFAIDGMVGTVTALHMNVIGQAEVLCHKSNQIITIPLTHVERVHNGRLYVTINKQSLQFFQPAFDKENES